MVHSDGSDGSRTVTSFESYSVQKRSVQEKTTLPNIYLCKNPEHYLTRRQQDLCKDNLYSFAASLQVRSYLSDLKIVTIVRDIFLPYDSFPFDSIVSFFNTIFALYCIILQYDHTLRSLPSNTLRSCIKSLLTIVSYHNTLRSYFRIPRYDPFLRRYRMIRYHDLTYDPFFRSWHMILLIKVNLYY